MCRFGTGHAHRKHDQQCGGRFDVLKLTFVAVKPGMSKLDLTVIAAAEARTFADLLPGLVVRDGALWAR